MTTRSLQKLAIALAFVAVLTDANARCRPAGTASTVQAAAETPVDDVWTILLPRAEAGSPETERMSRALAELGDPAVGELCAILFADQAEPDVEYEVHPLAIDRRMDVILGALLKLPPAGVVAGVQARITAKPNPDRIVFGARVLGTIGGPEALDVLESIAPTLDEMQWQRPFVQTVFEEALTRIARQDPACVRKLGTVLTRAESRCAPSMVRALGTTQSPAVVPVFLRMLGRNRELDLCLMHEIARFGERGDLGSCTGDVARLRSYCDGNDVGLKRAAAAALARIGDEESTGALITMLDSRDVLTISIAESSLKQLTGVGLGKDSREWSAWRQKETSWYETQYPVLLEELAGDDAERKGYAIRALAGHRLYRHQAALAVRPLLLEGDDEMQARVCTALGLYGSARAIPWLCEKLDSPEETVRREACAALRRLTGLDAGEDAEAWRLLVGS